MILAIIFQRQQADSTKLSSIQLLHQGADKANQYYDPTNHSGGHPMQNENLKQQKGQTKPKSQFDDYEVPLRLQKLYDEKKQQQKENSISSQMISSQHNRILLHLKELHMAEQSKLVSSINSVSEESKKMISELSAIETEIDRYHSHIEMWINKIEDFQEHIDKIKSVECSFERKAVNISRLKDFLNVQRPRRR